MKKYHLQGRMKIKWFCKQFDKSIIFLQRGLMMAMVHPRDNARVTHANKILNKIFPLRLLLRMTKISLKSCQHKSSDFLLSNRRTRLYTRVYCLSAFNELRLLRVSLFLYSLAYISNIHHTYFCHRGGISSTMLFLPNSVAMCGMYVVNRKRT